MYDHQANEIRPFWPLAWAALMVGIFFFDATTPLGFAVPILYAIPLALTRWIDPRLNYHWMATGFVALTWIGMLFSPGDHFELAVANRTMLTATFIGLAVGLDRYWHLTQKAAVAEELRRSESFIASVFDHLPNTVFVKEAQSLRFVRFNKAGQELIGQTQVNLLGKCDYDFSPKEEADFFTAKDREVLASGRMLDIPEEPVHTPSGVRYVHTKKVPIVGADGTPQYLLGIAEDITEQRRDAAFLAAEKQTLELVAKGVSLNEVLTFLCRTIEAHTEPMLCSVMLVTDDGAHLISAAAPSLPEAYCRAVDGIPIGPTIGSCGSAAYCGKPAIVADIATHPLWKDYASVALQYGLQACWSQPILSSNGTVLGTFAAYYREPRAPQPSDLKLVERAGYLAQLAIEHARVTDALRTSEARFQAFMDHSPTVAFMKDEQGRHVYVNRTFERQFHLAPGDIAGKTNEDLFPEPIAARLREHDEAVLSSGQPLEVEETVPSPDGSSEHWLVLKFPLSDVSGRRFVGGVAVDITERKRAEAELRTAQAELEQRVMERTAALKVSEQRRLILLNSVDAIVWEADPVTFQITFISAQAERVLGYPAQEWLDDPEFWVRHIHPEDRDRVVTQCLLDTARGSHHEMDYRMMARDGRVVWFRDSMTPELADGKVIALRGIMVDITEDRRVEESLRELTLAQSFALPGIAKLDEHGCYQFVNDHYAAVLGCRPGDLLGTSWEPTVVPEDRPLAYQAYAEMSATGKGECEVRGIRRDGSLIYKQVVLVRLEEATGRAGSGHYCFMRDITDRKRLEADLKRSHAELEQRVQDRTAALSAANEALQTEVGERMRTEAALRKSQERFELAVRATKDGIWDWDIETGAVYWSDRTYELLGYQPGEFVPTYKWWVSTLHPDESERILDLTQRHLDARVPYDVELRMKTKDGSYRWFRDMGQALWDEEGRPFRMVGSISDVTDRREAEESLRALQTDLEKRVVRRTAELMAANESLELEIAERKRSEQALQDSQQRFQLVSQATQDAIWDWDIIRNSVWWSPSIELQWGYTQDQIEPTPDWWASRIHPEDRERILASVRDLLSSPGTEWSGEYRYRRADGTYRVVMDRGYVLRDQQGQAVRMIGVEVDITAGKLAEEARRREAVMARVVEEREIIGRNLHDGVLQSLYAVRLGLERTSRLSKTNPEQVASHLEQQIQDIGLAIADMRRFLEGHDPAWANPGDLRTGLTELITLYRSISPLQWDLQIPEGALPTRSLSIEDTRNLLYIVREAMSNVARHASATRCAIRLEEAGDGWRLTVEDNGAGLTHRRARRKGRGIGNMEARAKQLGAGLTISGVPGVGTRIAIELTRKEAHAAI